ncbi:ABC transporter ATP-binding protein [Streptomyces sp. RKND-216]|uniref:ABC transporter ATP-binding protein n=1 Tax=Streptomyces sp. RKND-216 TaxID=2562581 RepID=UPI00109DE806|nr:ABC transporter ATP-binding protein [Streptomyces sp. RKND-216]THA27140.1 ABC transporter ATP-binding protein [Streptomyces sp. RKND-216]
MTDLRLTARGLTRGFSPHTGVRGIDLEVAAGEIHALVGLNGAGKTTLMRLLLGMLRPDSGTARIDGHDVRTAGAEAWARVGHLVDGPLCYADLDTRTNLRIAAALRGVPRGRLEEAVRAGITAFGLERYAGVRARVLSQGNRRRLGLAAALLHDPSVVVLDEPTDALDPRGVIRLREILLRRAGAGAGVLVSSHHLDEVARIADRVTVLHRGGVIGSLDPEGADIERAFFRLVHADEERHGDREAA